MRIFYTPPESEPVLVCTEIGLCTSKTIPGSGGEDRDPWEDSDD